jgi:ATPase subunit of ABC transporter with duplicated ATPase domains
VVEAHPGASRVARLARVCNWRMALLELRDASLSVGAHGLLDGASARVCTGQRVALVGRNGSGKSTLLRAIAEGLGCCSGIDEDAVPYFTLCAGSVSGEVTTALLVGQDTPRWEALLGPQTQLSEGELREMTLEDALDLAACYDEAAVDEADAWRDLCLRASSALG